MKLNTVNTVLVSATAGAEDKADCILPGISWNERKCQWTHYTQIKKFYSFNFINICLLVMISGLETVVKLTRLHFYR